MLKMAGILSEAATKLYWIRAQLLSSCEWLSALLRCQNQDYRYESPRIYGVASGSGRAPTAHLRCGLKVRLGIVSR